MNLRRMRAHLAEVLKDEETTDISANLEDRAERQAYMQKLVKETR